MATQTEVRQLTQTHRTSQVTRAAALAAVLAAFYRSKVDPSNPQQVEDWLDVFVPRILKGSSTGARLALRYAQELRTLEVPTAPKITLEPLDGSVAEQVRSSLRVVGPQDYFDKLATIDRLDVDPQQRDALIRDAKEVTAMKVAASTLRHVQSGGRATLIDQRNQDTTVIGWVRVTRATPCFFCAALASRGPVFDDNSFESSDPRFATSELSGDVKVHDGCQCSIKPLRNRKTDPIAQDMAKFEDLWAEWGAGGGDAMLRFRRGYEHWVKTGEKLPWNVVNDRELFRAR